jgi:hypothetical protein
MRIVSGILFLWFCSCAWADVCDPAKVIGAYAFQLSGTTKISGTEKPTASLGRLVFDGKGILSGTASAMYTGLLLGNPVTGTYEAKYDCSLTWKLQDDSGAYQNFSGTVSPDLSRVQFRQTDSGAAGERGTMQKAPDQCTTADLQPKYNYSVSGSTIPMQEGGAPRTVSAKGSLVVADTSVQIDGNCTLQFDLLLRSPEGDLMPMKMRGILVNGGKEILAIETDPGAMVSGRFISDSK